MQNEQQKNKRNTVILVSVAVYAVLALLFMVIINNAAISAWLKSVMSVLAPLIIGVAIAYLCNPLLLLFEKRLLRKIRSHRTRRVLSMVCTYLVLLIILSTILLIVIPQLTSSYNNFANSLRSYTDKAITFVNKLIYRINSMSEDRDLGKYIDISDIQRKVSELFNSSSGIFSTIAGYVMNYASSIAVGVKNALFGIFISIYILSSKERLAAQIKKILTAIFPGKRYSGFIEWVRFTNNTFGNYIKAQLLDALLVAVECAILFSITGMPYSVLLAFIIGVTNIIPVFGPFIGGIPAGFIVFISAPNKLLLFIILLVLIQQIDGNFVLPKLVGTTTGMSSLGVLCAITIMGGYFGIAGMILGVPFFVVLGEIIRRLVNMRLEKQGMSVSLADYHVSGTAPEDFDEEHKENLFVRTINKIGRFFAQLFQKIKQLFKRK
ncbi:MAG: AI-2E family transporter [Eubacteriales bacterium]|nr:AI-2E family transporter [Eubacteriales bacterium]